MIKSYKLTLTGLLVLCFGLHAMEESENFASPPTKVVTHKKQVTSNFIPTSKSGRFEKYINGGRVSKNKYRKKLTILTRTSLLRPILFLQKIAAHNQILLLEKNLTGLQDIAALNQNCLNSLESKLFQ